MSALLYMCLRIGSLFWRDSACSRCAKTSQIRVDLNAAEIAELNRKLRSEFGPYVVTSEEAEEVKVMLALADKDIEDHNPQVACFRRRHRTLVGEEKQRLETQRAKLRALLAPIRKLPNETLLRILQYVCDTNFLQSYPWLPSQLRPSKNTSPMITYLPAMAVSSVCSRWRELALSSPSLWADLQVEICTATPDKSKTLVGFIGTVTRYLERSGDWPLRLALSVQKPLLLATELASLNHFTRHAFRWKTFLYHGHSYPVYDILSRLEFPLLTELDVFTAGIGNLVPWNRFEHSPRLHQLITDVMPASMIVCNRLDYLKYRGLSLEKLAETLRHCPSLKSLMLESKYHIATRSLTQDSLTWHNITSLVIREYLSHSYSAVVFPLFDFPSLNELAITGVSEEQLSTPWPANAFISFVSRLSCMITNFSLLNISLSDLELITVLKAMPVLLYLEVEDRHAPGFRVSMYERSPITSRLTSSLAQHSISLVPKLHTLHLRSHHNNETSGDPTFDDSAFVSMVQSRWFKPGSDLSSEMLAIGRSSIRSVVLKFFWREVDVEVYKPLCVLDKEGLRVVVTGTNGVQV